MESRQRPTILIVVPLIGDTHFRGDVVETIVIVSRKGQNGRNEDPETFFDSGCVVTFFVVHATVSSIGVTGRHQTY
jgi:hypothetical protein